MARGTARPPISTGSTGLPKCLHLEVAGAFWYLGRESLSFVMRWVIVLRDTRGGRRWRGLASVGWVMDNREPCGWTGAQLQPDNSHRSRSINDVLSLRFQIATQVRGKRVIQLVKSFVKTDKAATVSRANRVYPPYLTNTTSCMYCQKLYYLEIMTYWHIYYAVRKIIQGYL